MFFLFKRNGVNKVIINEKKEIEKINKIYETLSLGEVKKTTVLKKRPDRIYRIQTVKKDYLMIKYNPQAIRREKDLNNRKRQLSIAEKLSTNGVPMILPLKFDRKFFIRYKKEYYLIYDYKEYETRTVSDLKPKAIKKLANTAAIIHKLNIKSEIPCPYNKIDIKFSKYLKKCQKINQELYQTLYNNYFLLEEIMKQCNENSKYAQNYICVSYKNKQETNILWVKDYMYIADYTSFVLENPAVSLAENAFFYARVGNTMKEENYKEYLKSYIRKYGPLLSDYKVALTVAPLNLLIRLESLLENCTKKEEGIIDKTIEAINELVLYANHRETFYNIYLSIVKK